MSGRVAGRGDPGRGRIGGRGDPGRTAWRSQPLDAASLSAWSSSSAWATPGGPTRRRAFAVGEARAVPFSKATELNSEIAKLSASVGEWATKKVGTFAPDESAAQIAARFPNASDGELFLQFRQFKADWDAFYTWRRDNPPPWYVPIPSVAMTEAYGDLPQYDALLARYEAILARAKAAGIGTAATVPDQDSALENAVDSATDGLGKGFGKGLESLGELGTYVVAGALVVGGLYLAGPLIWKAVRR